MAGVAKWLRQWFVVPPFVGSSPIVRPFLGYSNFLLKFSQVAIVTETFTEIVRHLSVEQNFPTTKAIAGLFCGDNKDLKV